MPARLSRLTGGAALIPAPPDVILVSQPCVVGVEQSRSA